MNKKTIVLTGIGLTACLVLGFLWYSQFGSDSSNSADGDSNPALTMSGVENAAYIASETETGTVLDWCASHRVPESECTKCHQALIAEFKAKGDWCAEHGLPESHCRLCNGSLTFPQEQQISSRSLQSSSGELLGNAVPAPDQTPDWCMEHRVPESKCTKCNPGLTPAFKNAGDWCVEHNLPESNCRLCNPRLTFPQEPKSETSVEDIESADESYRPSVYFPKNATQCATNEAIIQFASAETAERAGLTVVPALSVEETATVEAPAEVTFDETKSYVITTTVNASVVRWLAEPGTAVSVGQALAELESPDMPNLKAEYLEAFSEAQVAEQEFVRVDSLSKLGLISIAEAQQVGGRFKTTHAHMSGARGLLEACGLSADDIEFMQSNRAVTPRWLLRASNGGVLLERKAPLGELLMAGSSLALVGDPSVLWIEANVRESDLSLFRNGQLVEFATDGDALERVSGRVIWVAQYVDPVTRSARVRAEVLNSSLRLKANQFGRLSLPTSMSASTVAVPRDAVQWEGCCNVVFVKEAEDRYRPHKVDVSRGDRGFYNITSGLQAGDLVVVKGSYSLKTELKKGSLGAGCCDVAPKS